MNKKINQKTLSLIEYYNLLNADILINNRPINRLKNIKNLENGSDKTKQLQELKKTIESIKNCELKKSASKMVFSDGNLNSKIMMYEAILNKREDVLS